MEQFVRSGYTGWLLTGNSGTNPVYSFIGTTDNQPLRFRVNIGWAGAIETGTGNNLLGIVAGQLNRVG